MIAMLYYSAAFCQNPQLLKSVHINKFITGIIDYYISRYVRNIGSSVIHVMDEDEMSVDLQKR